MKTYKNLYEKMLEPECIKDAVKKASKKKKNRKDVKDVLNHLDDHVKIIQRILMEESFEPNHHQCETINENNYLKVRKIIKPDFKYEQIIHHLVVSQLQPIIMRGLDPFVCGSIPGRGPHYGERFIKKWVKQYKGRKFYILKMDIHHFYESVDQTILLHKLTKIIKDEKFINLIKIMLSVKENGLPIGYFTSQWFGNFYLKDLDRYIKQDLKAEHYMRYADDMIIFGRNKKQLHKMRQAIETCLNNIGLTLNAEWQVYKFETTPDKRKPGKYKERPLDFMGFVTHRNRVGIRKTNLNRIRKKANKLQRKEKASWHDAASMLSRMGWFKHTDSYGYYLAWIKPKVDVKDLKRQVGRHQREQNRKEGKK